MDPSITEYLERLDARLDAYTNAIRSLAEKPGAHVVSPPAVVQTPPPPTTSPASTTDVSVPVPDIFCSITKVQEIPTVAHDAAPVCITVVPVTCSTECSTQVNTIDEVHNAATAVDLEPTVDPIHQAVEQLSSVQATTSIGTNTPSSVEVVSPVTNTTNVDPKAGVQELEALSVDTSTQVISKADHDVAPITIPVPAVAFQPALDTTAHVAKGLGSDPDDTNAELTHTVTPTEIPPELASLEVCGACHGVVTVNINIPTASAFTRSPVWPSSNSDTFESSPPSTHKDAQEVLELLPGLFDKPEAALDDDVKEHKDDAKLSVITFVLNSPIWYEHFSPRDSCFVLLDDQRVIEEHMRSELHLTWPPLVGINFSELSSSGQFDSDRTLSLFPWNPGGYLLKHRNPMTMMLITASSGSHWHVTGVIEESDLCNFGVMWYLDHGSLRIKQWWLDTQCLLLVNAIFAAFFWHEGHIFGNSLQDLTTCSQFQLFLSGVTSLFCMETSAASCLWDISDYLERFVACCCIIVARDIPTLHQPIMHFMGNLYLSDLEGQSAICFVQPSCQLHAQYAEQMFIFSPKNVQLKLQYFACDCRAVRVWSELLRTELLDKFWNLSGHHILEHAIVCTVPMSDKLQRNIQLISLSVHRKKISQEEFNGSVHFTRGCHLSFLLAYWTVQHIMRPCLLSEPRTCEVNHGYYVKILKLFAVQAIQFATVLHYSDNSIVSVMAPVVDSSNTGYFLDILSLTWMGSATNSESCECFPGNKYVAVMHSVRQLLDIVHRCRMMYNAVESNKFNCRIQYQCTEYGIDQSFGGIKAGLYLFSANTSRKALMVLMLKWSLSSCWEFLAGTIVTSTSATCTTKLCSTSGITFSFSCQIQLWFCMVKHNNTFSFSCQMQLWSCMVKHNNSMQVTSSSAEVLSWFNRSVSRSQQISRATDYKSGVELKPSMSCFCALLGSLFELSLSSGKEYVVGLMAISITGVCISSVAAWIGYSVGKMHKSWDPGGVTIPAFNLQSSMILMSLLIRQVARATSGMPLLRCFDQACFQGGRGVNIVTFVFVKGSIDHEYNLGFNHDAAGNDHYINNSLDGLVIGYHHYYLMEVHLNFGCHSDSDHIKECRALWDPGGPRWRRLGVKPSFKEGGMLGASPTWASPLDPHMGLARPAANTTTSN